MDFGELSATDRIVVEGSGRSVVATVTDPQKVRRAVEFIQARPDGWAESWRGPKAGYYNLLFYKKEHAIAVCGLAPNYIVWGGVGPSRDVAPSDVESLMSALGIHW
jgi:hypothetical protein